MQYPLLALYPQFASEQLPHLRTELDALTQQMATFTHPDAISTSNGVSGGNQDMLRFLLPVDTRQLETSLAASHRRLDAASKEIEAE